MSWVAHTRKWLTHSDRQTHTQTQATTIPEAKTGLGKTVYHLKSMCIILGNDYTEQIFYAQDHYCDTVFFFFVHKQGKSEGFESCDRPIIRKRPIWVKIGDVLSRVTLKFDGWPWKTIGHLSFAVSSFVQHFIAIGEFKLELLSGNAQFGSNSMIFRAVWPWNLTYDLEKQ